MVNKWIFTIICVNFPVPMSLPSFVHFHEGSDMTTCTMSFNFRTGGSRAPRRAGKIVGGGDAIGECLGNLFFRLWQQLAVYYLWKNLLELCDRNHTLGIFLEAKEVIRSWATSELGHTSYTGSGA